jgi:hypothetical protein
MITQGSRVCHAALEARNSFYCYAKEAGMMDEALKTHKESTFGWMLAVEELIAAFRARLARLACEQTEEAIREAQGRRRRYLTLR